MYSQCHHKDDGTAFVLTFPEGLEKDGALFPLSLVGDKDKETWSPPPLCLCNGKSPILCVLVLQL